MNDKTTHDSMREMVRQLVQEAVDQVDMAPAMAAGRTFDTEGFKAFMKRSGLFGSEEDILSIIEGQPSETVINDVSEYVAFHKTGEDVTQMNSETMLDHYLEWNHFNVDKSKILAFSIREV